MAHLYDLPVELLSEITGWISEQDDLLHLSYASRDFNAVANPYLYREYKNTDSRNNLPFRPFLRTIAKRPDLARCVREVELRLWRSEAMTGTSPINEEDIDLFISTAKKAGVIDVGAECGAWEDQLLWSHYRDYCDELRDIVAEMESPDSVVSDLPISNNNERRGGDENRSEDSQGDGEGAEDETDDDSYSEDWSSVEMFDDFNEDLEFARSMIYQTVDTAREDRLRSAETPLKEDVDWLRMIHGGVEDAEVVLLLALLPRLEHLVIKGVPSTPHLHWKSFILDSSNAFTALQSLHINTGPEGWSLEQFACLLTLPSLHTLRGDFCEDLTRLKAGELEKSSSRVTTIDLDDSYLSEDGARQLVQSCTALKTFGYGYESFEDEAFPFPARSVKRILRSQQHSLQHLRLQRVDEIVPFQSKDSFLGSMKRFEKLETIWMAYETLMGPIYLEDIEPELVAPTLAEVLPPSIVSLNLSFVLDRGVSQLLDLASHRHAKQFMNLKTINIILVKDGTTWSVYHETVKRVESAFEDTGIEFLWCDEEDHAIFTERARSNWLNATTHEDPRIDSVTKLGYFLVGSEW